MFISQTDKLFNFQIAQKFLKGRERNHMSRSPNQEPSRGVIFFFFFAKEKLNKIKAREGGMKGKIEINSIVATKTNTAHRTRCNYNQRRVASSERSLTKNVKRIDEF